MERKRLWNPNIIITTGVNYNIYSATDRTLRGYGFKMEAALEEGKALKYLMEKPSEQKAIEMAPYHYSSGATLNGIVATTDRQRITRQGAGSSLPPYRQEEAPERREHVARVMRGTQRWR
ncbi:MAG: hypothetical protein WCX65_15675 [bacterium]